MIQPTKQLMELFHSEAPVDTSIIQSYCDVIAQYGQRDDAAILLDWYMKHPADSQYISLLRVVMRCGDLELAAALYEHSFQDGKLKDDAPDGILHILAYMGYPLATPYVVDCVSSSDQDACLALLHMPYNEHYAPLIDLFDQIYGEALFPELLPALCVKWVAAEKIVPKLLDWGKQASTDCNGGLVLGIAMYGAEQKETMKQILWDSDWELYSNGTGGHWWAYMAMPLVELTFAELILDLKYTFSSEQRVAGVLNGVPTSDATEKLKESAEHCFEVLYSLLQLKLEGTSHPLRYVTANQESMLELYQQLFAWSTPHVDDSILGVIVDLLGIDHRLADRFYDLRSAVELAARHELEIGVLR